MMSEIVTAIKIDETWLKLECDPDILFELDESFKFLIPNHRYNPKVKSKIWDGYIHPINKRTRKTHVGLFKQIEAFCKKRNYTFQSRNDGSGIVEPNIRNYLEKVENHVAVLKMTSGGTPLEIRDYQMEAIYHSLYEQRAIIQSPTSSGKSSIMYAICRLLSDGDEKVLLIVPNIGLVAQMYSDFDDYSSKTNWRAEENCHTITAGAVKQTDKLITISTWQSLLSVVKNNPSWFKQFDCVMCDETHLAVASSISSIMEASTHARYKLGFTGSLTNTKMHLTALVGLFGPIKKVASTKDLIDKGFLSSIRIKTLLLKYSPLTCKAYSRAEYKNEIQFLAKHELRNRFIRNLACSLKGNTLILFNFIEHGTVLYDSILAKYPDREVYFIDGSVDAEIRNDVRAKIELAENAIIVASLGTTSTGTSIKRLNNIIFASPSKSLIRVLQSIGRGLRVAHDKNSFVLYDIADDLRHKKQKNHTFNHYIERLKIYADEQFEYSINEVQLEKVDA